MGAIWTDKPHNVSWLAQERWNQLLQPGKDPCSPGELCCHSAPDFFNLSHTLNRATAIGFHCLHEFLLSFRAVTSKGKEVGNKLDFSKFILYLFLVIL